MGEIQKTLMDIQKKDSLREQIEAFNGFLNSSDPSSDNVKQVPVGGGQKASYVPIEVGEMMMDMIFGEWSVENSSWKREINEICFTLDIVVRSPVTNNLIRRSGAGAAPIQQRKVYDKDHPKADKKGFRPALLSEFEDTKVSNAIQSALPAAKAMAYTNAFRSLGKKFGRDLNRDARPQFVDIYKGAAKAESEEKKRAMEFINSKDDPQQLMNAFSDELLSKYPEVDEALNSKLEKLRSNGSKDTSKSKSGGKADGATKAKKGQGSGKS